MDKPGYYQGRHFTTYIEEVEELKRAQHFTQAEALLIKLVEVVEREAKAEGWGVPPWYYEMLAIIYRKQKNFPAEVAILERFFHQQHKPNPKLEERLLKAQKLLTAKAV